MEKEPWKNDGPVEEVQGYEKEVEAWGSGVDYFE
jgi:hypothetical protein